MGATRHVYDIFGEIATDYCDPVRVSSTFVRDSFDIVRDYYGYVRI